MIPSIQNNSQKINRPDLPQPPPIKPFPYLILREDTGSIVERTVETSSAYKKLEDLARQFPDIQFILYNPITVVRSVSTTTYTLQQAKIE